MDNLGLERKVEDVVTALTADAARRAEILCEDILYDSGLEAPDLTSPPWQRSSPLARRRWSRFAGGGVVMTRYVIDGA